MGGRTHASTATRSWCPECSTASRADDPRRTRDTHMRWRSGNLLNVCPEYADRSCGGRACHILFESARGGRRFYFVVVSRRVCFPCCLGVACGLFETLADMKKNQRTWILRPRACTPSHTKAPPKLTQTAKMCNGVWVGVRGVQRGLQQLGLVTARVVRALQPQLRRVRDRALLCRPAAHVCLLLVYITLRARMQSRRGGGRD